MIQKIEALIRQYHMINAGDHVIAGVSGGADSLCLLLVLLRLREELGHTVSALHVEHGIRGEASMRDAEFVRHFCETRGIECQIHHCSVPEYARAHRMGEEEAGRKLRYAAFGAAKEKAEERYPGRNVKIAVAHNLGDNAETMLFHLARGTGILGLAGIAPVRGDIIRPLLSVSREEIEAYLEDLGQGFCTDATNGTDGYSRNRLRHHVLPVLHGINSRADWHMYEASKRLREIGDYLKRQALDALEACRVDGADGTILRKEEFERVDPVLQTEMLHHLLKELSGSGKNITKEHIVQLKELFAKQNGRRIQLPYGIEAGRVYEGVELYVCKAAESEGTELHGGGNAEDRSTGQYAGRNAEDRSTGQYAGKNAEDRGTGQYAGKNAEGRSTGQYAGKNAGDRSTGQYAGKNAENSRIDRPDDRKEQFSFRIIENFSGHIPQISKKKYTKCFDYDKIKVGFCIRGRRPGDYLVVDASGNKQKLKKYLINEKIPVKEREQLLVLADGAHIMWAVGHRISSYYKVDEGTRKILEVTFHGGKEDE